MADTCSGLHDPYEDQLAAARYRAERDMLAQAMERVADDIEWTFLGFEGAEDAPAMRWAMEFRAALGSLHAPGFQKSRKVATSLTSHSDASDVTMSAHDLLPEEEREAIALVREHGGIEELRRMFLDADNRRIELCGALGIDLGTGWSDAMAELDRHLMPEGMEWPRDAKGEPIVRGDTVWTNGNSCGDGRAWHLQQDLTHERPDSWERLEEDADRTAKLFDAFDSDASADIRDLVRRARALAEREQ